MTTATGEAGELLEERRRHRLTVIRMALLYTPGAIIVLALLAISVVSVFQGSLGALIPAVILGLIGAALTTQAIAALRDLPAEPTTTTGTIRRAWSKGLILGLFRTYYVLVNRAVFDISIVSFAQVQEGDRLEVHHWPHTKTVISVYKLRGDAARGYSEEARRSFEPKQEEFVMPDATDMTLATRYGLGWWKLRDAFWRRWRS
jgi:hypothetical protein